MLQRQPYHQAHEQCLCACWSCWLYHLLHPGHADIVFIVICCNRTTTSGSLLAQVAQLQYYVFSGCGNSTPANESSNIHFNPRKAQTEAATLGKAQQGNQSRSVDQSKRCMVQAQGSGATWCKLRSSQRSQCLCRSHPHHLRMRRDFDRNHQQRRVGCVCET